MSTNSRNNLIQLLTLLFFVEFSISATENESQSKLTNSYCLQCHGNLYYNLTDDETGKTRRKLMSINCIIDTSVYKLSNHKNFKCTNCHSNEFKQFPHPKSALLEEIGSCVDCHSGDSIAQVYKFDLIDIDFQQSVHATKHSENFTCWMCHEAHSYKVKANTIEYDNSMCLSCHANPKRYNLIIEKNNPNIIEKHEWLPNQQLHFQNVRCIECHARINDSVLVAHNIQPKAKAVKMCKECHSTNTLLQQTLYKFQSKEAINKNGYFNGVILNNSYVIGANRNYFLNMASLAIFLMVVIGIIIHSILRIKFK